MCDKIPLTADKEILEEFTVEYLDDLKDIEAAIHRFASSPTDTAILGELLRSFHTFKGDAGILNLPQLVDMAHEVETLLDLCIRGELSLQSDLRILILEMLDICREVLHQLREALDADTGLSKHPKVPCWIDRIRQSVIQHLTEPKTGEVHPQSVVREVHTPKQTVRVQVNDLHALKHAITKISAGIEFEQALSDAQVYINKLLYVSPKLLLKACRKAAEYTAEQLGKKVHVTISGEDVEIERVIAEKLQDAVQHLVRNAVDHGVESCEERRKAGKAETGEIQISLSRQNGQVLLEVRDDGRGIDTGGLAKEAEIRGIDLHPERSKPFQVLFRPGFSTAKKLTQISGRGIGLDVVKVSVEELGGSIEVASQPKVGTTFRIYLDTAVAR